MKIFDISWPISVATTGYKDKNVVEFEPVKTFARDNARETNIRLSTHTGTHIDAPAHFLRDGITIDQMTVDRFIGPAKVIDMSAVSDSISGEHLEEYADEINEGEIILLKTVNSDTRPTEKFTPHFIYLDHTGATYLAEKKIKAVGIDYLGIERSQEGHPTHGNLMKADICVIEGLRLGHVPAGNYFFVCLPLYLIGLEAAPARAILITE